MVPWRRLQALIEPNYSKAGLKGMAAAVAVGDYASLLLLA